MRDFGKIPMNQAAATTADGPPVESTNKVLALIDEGNALEEQGRTADAMALYDAAVQADPRCARAHLNRGNVLLGCDQLDEARSAYQLAIACDPHYAAPHFNLGNLNYRAGEYERALRDYQAAINIKPDFAQAFVAMANSFDSLGRAAEAVESYERALAFNPAYPEAHFNLGLLATAQGRLDEAAKSLRSAIDIRPDYAAAHLALGRVMGSLGHLDAAEANLRRALSLEPDSAEILCNLAINLLSRGKASEALPLMMRTLERARTWTTKTAFAGCVARTESLPNDSQVRAALTSAITETWGIPYELCPPAIRLIMLNRSIADCVRRANVSWPARPPKAMLFGADGLAALAADRLLHALLEATPVTSIDFERFLTCARHALLEIASSQQAPAPSDRAALSFYAALTRQCFVNEYIFACSDGELLAAAACRTELLALLDANVAVAPFLVLAVAAYFPTACTIQPGFLPRQKAPRPLTKSCANRSANRWKSKHCARAFHA